MPAKDPADIRAIEFTTGMPFARSTSIVAPVRFAAPVTESVGEASDVIARRIVLFSNERLAALTLPVGAMLRTVPVPSAASAPESASVPFTVSVWLPARYTPPPIAHVFPPAIVAP